MLGTVHQVEITSLANSGDGVGRIENKVIFIPFTAPGDLVKAKITSDKNSFYQGHLVELIKASPVRTKPTCPYFGDCGGCDWQHLPYKDQLKWKHKSIVDTFSRIGHMKDAPVKDIVPSPQPYNYRNRIQLHYDNNGFYYHRRQSDGWVPVESCAIADDRINQSLADGLSSLQKTKGKKKVEFAIVDNEVGVFQVHGDKGSELGFRQVNSPQNQNIIDHLVSFARENSVEKIVDLYCGQGNWTIPLAKALPDSQCLGIDVSKTNISKARERSSHGSLDNVEFILGKVEDKFTQQSMEKGFIILDPPRAGCDKKIIKALAQNPPEWLCYISCHPATLVRDLQTLITNTFDLVEVIPFDMFPQTGHVECWSLLRRRS